MGICNGSLFTFYFTFVSWQNIVKNSVSAQQRAIFWMEVIQI